MTLIVDARDGQSRKWISPGAKIGMDIHNVDENSSGKVRVENSSPTDIGTNSRPRSLFRWSSTLLMKCYFERRALLHSLAVLQLPLAADSTD